DYRQLVELTGFRPPRHVVEANVAALARRVLQREHELVTRAQSAWRGISVRRHLHAYRDEVRRVRQIHAGMAFRIQRVYRAWLGRRRWQR
ncbi:unnamed protein product, partial [Phaeothamnion confervicola]